MDGQSNDKKGLIASRREYITDGVAQAKLGSASALPDYPSSQQASMPAASVQALTFDVFGTVVDWRSAIIREGQRLTKRKGLQMDWAKFADARRAGRWSLETHWRQNKY